MTSVNRKYCVIQKGEPFCHAIVAVFDKFRDAKKYVLENKDSYAPIKLVIYRKVFEE
jgi:hypothetical protein